MEQNFCCVFLCSTIDNYKQYGTGASSNPHAHTYVMFYAAAVLLRLEVSWASEHSWPNSGDDGDNGTCFWAHPARSTHSITPDINSCVTFRCGEGKGAGARARLDPSAWRETHSAHLTNEGHRPHRIRRERHSTILTNSCTTNSFYVCCALSGLVE